ncbi:MAG: Hsp20/alpha crystallin family protein [Thermodesulfobacteriota bacterium]
MELMPWKPLGDLRSLRREMDDLWGRFLEGRPFGALLSQGWAPSADISETKDKVIVKIDLPGFEAADVQLSISGDLLTVKGEKKQEQEEKDEHHHYVERSYGAFQRTFRLPVEIDSDKVQARFDKGVLRITLPKTARAKKKEIKVQVK